MHHFEHVILFIAMAFASGFCLGYVRGSRR
jgi:hypothetical protein